MIMQKYCIAGRLKYEENKAEHKISHDCWLFIYFYVLLFFTFSSFPFSFSYEMTVKI